jgi:hypothetical protein
MSTVYVHLTTDGNLWVGHEPTDVPPGTLSQTFKFNSECKFQSLGLITGTTGALTAASTKSGESKNSTERV